MKSPGPEISPSRANLAERLSNVIQASRHICSEVALTICESSETRVASRQLRMDSRQVAERSAAWRQRLLARKAQRTERIAHAIAQILSKRGYSAFVAAQQQDTASVQ